jgi:RNA polymerase sigma factor (sigma-70 family)
MSVTEPSTVRQRILASRFRDDDAALVRRTQAGDERAFAAIFEHHHASLLSYCRHMLGDRDDGEDALQQTFIKAHRALVGGTTPRELRPWLYAIARNCCRSAIAARRSTTSLEERTPALAGLSEEVHQREDLRELLDGIGRLPEDQRSALLLAELDDLSHQAIATVLGCPVSKVKALVYQARSFLIAERDARGTPCQDIREQLAVARGGELRRGPLRRHLNLCTGCRDFQLAVGAQRQSLASVLPITPSAGLVAAILGHGSAHAVGAAGIGGAGAGVAPAGGAAATSAGAAGAGATASAGSGIAAGATGATSAAVGAGAGGGTSAGALVGGGLITKLAVGGAVMALAAAGTVAARQRAARAVSQRVARARPASFAAYESEVASAVASGDAGASAGVQAPGSTAVVLSGGEGSTVTAGAGPFGGLSVSGPSGNDGAQTLLTLASADSPSVTGTTVADPSAVKAGQSGGGEGVLAKAQKARAKRRRAALRRRASRLRKVRRVKLRKARHKALARRRRAAAPKLKTPKPTTAPVTTAPVRIHHRRVRSATAPTGASSESATDSESKGTKKAAKVRSHPSATGTGVAGAKTTGTDPETGTVATGKGKGKVSSHPGIEKTGSTEAGGTTGAGTGTAGSATGTEKAGSTTGKDKTGAGAGAEKSGSGAGSRETASGAGGGKTAPETPSGERSTAGKSGSTKASDAGSAASETSGTGTTSAKGGSAHAKKHLVEEEQLPNL